jgi:hypothetical protein
MAPKEFFFFFLIVCINIKDLKFCANDKLCTLSPKLEKRLYTFGIYDFPLITGGSQKLSKLKSSLKLKIGPRIKKLKLPPSLCQ